VSQGEGRVVAVFGPGWSGSSLDGPVPWPNSCYYRYASDGYELPDPACTPGAVDSQVTQTNLAQTICRPGGWSDSVRPPESVTEAFKEADMAAYGRNGSLSGYELDHLVPLGLGGASDTYNLWVEPDRGSPAQFDPTDPYGRNAKDGVEDALHTAVCEGRVGLAAAQEAIASDWTTALARLGLSGG
jgi:hypothetical protein